MDELVNLTLEQEIERYHRLPTVNSTIYKIISSRSLCYILYKLYQHYLLKADYAHLYSILYRKISIIFKWHNSHERTYNRKHNLIYVDLDEFMSFMFYIRANHLSISTELFEVNLSYILTKYNI